MSFVIFLTWCFHALFLLVPFVFTWVNSELFEFNKMLVVYGFTIVIGALWLARCVAEKRLIWKKHPAVLLILLFLTGQAAATLFSIHFRTSLFGFYSRLNGGFFSSLAYSLLFLALINNVPKKQAFSLLLTSAVAVLLASLYAIPEHFGLSPSCYLMKQQLGVACWKQAVQERVFGTFGQPNWLAMYIVGLAPVVILFVRRQIGILRTFWLAVLAVLLLTLWYTKSRSGLLGLVAVGITWIMLEHQLLWLKQVKKIFRSRWSRTTVILVIVGALIGSGVLLSATVPLAETSDSFDLSQGSESGSIRLIVWRGALKVWQRYPLFGSGPGSFAYSYYQDRPVEHNLVSEWDHLYNKAHNEFLNYLAETGSVGTLTYLIFLSGIGWLLMKQIANNPQKLTAAHAGLASVIGLSVTHFFGFSTVTSNLLLFLVPAMALLDIETATFKPAAPKLWQKLVLIAIGLLALFLLLCVGRIWQADWHYTQGKKYQEKLEYPEALAALQTATRLSPNEPLYYDELANLYSKLALTYALGEETGASQQLGEAAIQNSDYTILLNPRHLNFYKTRVRVFFILAQIDPQYFAQAEKTLKAALTLSPTDAQLWYNLGIAQLETGKFEEAIQNLEYTVEIKPNYVKARSQLGDLLIQLGRIEEGRTQYRFILEKLSPTDEEIKVKLDALTTQSTDQ